MAAPRSLDDILGELQLMDEAEEAVQWRRGELTAEALALPGMTARQLAVQTGWSAGYLLRLARTWHTFPAEHDRVFEPPITWTHHRLAAETDRPREWLAVAVERQWSTRDLQDAIGRAAAADPVAAEERQWAAAVQRVRKRLQEGPPDQRAARREELWRVAAEVGV